MTQGRMLIRNLAAEATVANVELPAEMTEAVETVERLEAAFNQLPATPPVDAAAAMLEDEVYTAVWAGKEVPDVRMRYAKLKVDVESATVGAQVLRGAIKRSDDRLASVFFDNVDTMLVDHLKPAHADLLSHAESLLPALEGARTERDAYAKNHGAAAAWQDLQQLAVRTAGYARRTTSCGVSRSTSAPVTMVASSPSSRTVGRSTRTRRSPAGRPRGQVSPPNGWYGSSRAMLSRGFRLPRSRTRRSQTRSNATPRPWLPRR